MKKLINELSLKVEYRNIKPFTIQFREGINLIVGENGIGKSSILHLLNEYSMDKNGIKDIISIKMEIHDHIVVRSFDTEKMNPRVTNTNRIAEVLTRFTSHGEAMIPLMKACNEFSNSIVIIDEPESGISLSNQKKLFEIFYKNAEEKGNQFIIVTHSYPIITSVEEVFCMDSKKGWIKSKNYLKKVLK